MTKFLNREQLENFSELVQFMHNGMANIVTTENLLRSIDDDSSALQSKKGEVQLSEELMKLLRDGRDGVFNSVVAKLAESSSLTRDQFEDIVDNAVAVKKIDQMGAISDSISNDHQVVIERCFDGSLAQAKLQLLGTWDVFTEKMGKEWKRA